MGIDAEKEVGGENVPDAPRLIFYTTDGCSLCEVALDQILGMPLLAGLRMEVIDVALDDDLVARYGATLPVLVFSDHELHAPFDAAKVEQWIYDSRL
ncbi:MAG: glutaredoxin family protein [Pseudomonadales bacterium]|nr:glutaredoxin family protein [Pseudomonadales bacterium]